jgi:hypothetical protein
MMGEKYIVIGTYYKDRFIAVEYLGETQKFIKIKEGRGAQIRRSKDSVIIVSTHDTMEGARKAAAQLTAKLKSAKSITISGFLILLRMRGSQGVSDDG